MAMSLSTPHPERPHELPGVKLGDEQFAAARRWEQAGRLALVGIGVEPGLSDVFARYAADQLFSEIDELGVRDGANLVVDGYDFAPSFSIWTTIEECLNPPVVYEAGRGWYTTPPFSEPEVFDFPGRDRAGRVRQRRARGGPPHAALGQGRERVTFKYGLGAEFIDVLETLHKLGLDRTDPVTVRAAGGPVAVSPRDVVAACLPDPATLGDRMRGTTCAGLWVTGTGKSTGSPARCTSTTWWTTPGRWRSTAASASSGRRRSTPSSRSSCSRRAPGRAPACSAPRPSTRCRSSTVSGSSAPTGGCRSGAGRAGRMSGQGEAASDHGGVQMTTTSSSAQTASGRPRRAGPAANGRRRHRAGARAGGARRRPDRAVHRRPQWRPGSGGGPFAVDDPSTQRGAHPGRRRDAWRTAGPRWTPPSPPQPSWAATPPRERGEILRRAFELITARADDLALLMTLEMGKPVKESKAEIAYAAEFFRWFSEEAVRISGRWSVAPNGASRLLTMKQPVGPCLFITPWNFPHGDGHPQDRPGGRRRLHHGRQAGLADAAVDVRARRRSSPRPGCPTASST